MKRLIALLLTLLGAGCAGESVPDLPVREVRYHAIPRAESRFPSPRAVAIGPAGEMYVLDTAGRVLVFDANLTFQRSWHMPEYAIGNPEGVCVLADGRVAVADTHYHRVVFFNSQGEVLGMQGRHGQGPGEFFYPVSITHDDSGYFYVAEYGNNDRVQKFSADGKFQLAFGGFGTVPGEFQRLGGIAWHDGKVYCCDVANNRLQVFAADGRFLEVLVSNDRGPVLDYPYDIAIGAGSGAAGSRGALFIVEYGAGRVAQLDLTGRLLGRFGRAGRGAGELSRPWGLAVTDDGRVIVADTENRRLVELRLE
jgi:DNA-binding beta-propeller fold protein YncE